MADFWHSPDSYSPPAITVEAKKTAPDSLGVLNAELTKSGLRVEVPETFEAIVERIRDRIMLEYAKQGKTGIDKREIQVWKVREWLYATQRTKGGISTYRSSDGRILLSIGNEVQSPFIKNYENPDILDGSAMKQAGFIEKKEDGVWNLYELIGTDEKRGYVLGRKLDPKAPEYYYAWKDIVFYADTRNVLTRLSQNMDVPEQGIKNLVKGGSVKFEMLDYLLKKDIITPEVFQVGVSEMRKIIVSQCGDARFEGFASDREYAENPELAKLWSPVRESDLRKYFEKGYVDGELAKACFAAIPAKYRDLSGGK